MAYRPFLLLGYVSPKRGKGCFFRFAVSLRHASSTASGPPSPAGEGNASVVSCLRGSSDKRAIFAKVNFGGCGGGKPPPYGWHCRFYTLWERGHQRRRRGSRGGYHPPAYAISSPIPRTVEDACPYERKRRVVEGGGPRLR